ncbi:MAG: CidA/LrgA family protein [Acidihalobacter sp.]|jgi:holin-like protein
MSKRHFIVTSRLAVHHSRLLQILLLCAFWLLGEGAVRLTGLPVPGGIVGMLLVLGLLLSGRVSLGSMRLGAQWFLAELLLFFIPAVLAVLGYQQFFGLLGLKILLVILVGTLCVMGVTALTVEFCYRWRIAHHAAH